MPWTESLKNKVEELCSELPKAEATAVRAWLLGAFHPFQLEWILDFGRFSLILKSRQIGCSHTIAGCAVLWGIFGETTSVISLTQREADELVEKAAKHAEILTALGSKWAVITRRVSDKMVLASGGRILALPNSNAGRSYAGNMILDELAYYAKPDEVFDGAGGTTTHGYKLRVLSTPNGVGNFFHRLWTDSNWNKGYTKHKVTVDEAIADGMTGLNLDDLWRQAHGDPRTFNQMFRCSFLDNNDQYISSDLVSRAVRENTYKHHGVVYAGLDIGRKADLTVLTIVKVTDTGERWVQRVETRKRTSDDDLDALAFMAIAEYGAAKLCVDATGMGSFPAERLQKRYGRTRVEAVNFTLPLKEKLATTVYQTFADDVIRIPDNKALREDICAIRRIVSDAGNVRYDAPHTDEGHADRFWSLALALHGCSGPSKKKSEIPGT